MGRVLVLVIVGALAIPASITADVPFDAARVLESCDVVFVGQVDRIETMPNETIVAYLTVGITWKGELEETVAVAAPYRASECGIDFGVGEAWLVFATDGYLYRYETDSCSHTERATDAVWKFQELDAVAKSR